MDSTAENMTDKQIRKAKELENMFEGFYKSGKSIRVFCGERRIHKSKFCYWKKRYDAKGVAGLIDQRQGMPHKITAEVREFIRDGKIKDRNKSGADLAKDLYGQFKIVVGPQHVNKILRELGLNDPVGRKPGKAIKNAG